MDGVVTTHVKNLPKIELNFLCCKNFSVFLFVCFLIFLPTFFLIHGLGSWLLHLHCYEQEFENKHLFPFPIIRQDIVNNFLRIKTKYDLIFVQTKIVEILRTLLKIPQSHLSIGYSSFLRALAHRACQTTHSCFKTPIQKQFSSVVFIIFA